MWYATQPTVTKLAEDRAEELRRNPDAAAKELEERLKTDLRSRGGFDRIHVLPHSGADVPDDLDTRLVVLPPDYLCSREPGNDAEIAARAILESRGGAPRLYRNTLVFLAADRVRYQDLDEALRQFLAWTSILKDKEELNLDPHQTRQAETRWQAADDTVVARLPEAYQWLLTPEQETPQSALAWQAVRLTGGGAGAGARAGARTGRGRGAASGVEAAALAERAGRRLRHDERPVSFLGGTILRTHLDGVPLWRGEHVPVRQLVEDFARYPYLPRLAGPEVLARAVSDGLALLTWELEAFALAEGYDEAAGGYRGLQPGGRTIDVPWESAALLVRPDAARRRWDAEAPAPSAPPAAPGTVTGPAGRPGAGLGADKGTDTGAGTDPGSVAGGGTGRDTGMEPTRAPPENKARRFHGAVTLDTTRVGRDASRIAEEVVAHLSGLVGAEVTVTLEIEAGIPRRRPGQRGAHGDREQPHPEVRKPRIRRVVGGAAPRSRCRAPRQDGAAHASPPAPRTKPSRAAEPRTRTAGVCPLPERLLAFPAAPDRTPPGATDHAVSATCRHLGGERELAAR